jgi:hypothetical protein
MPRKVRALGGMPWLGFVGEAVGIGVEDEVAWRVGRPCWRWRGRVCCLVFGTAGLGLE